MCKFKSFTPNHMCEIKSQTSEMILEYFNFCKHETEGEKHVF